MKHFWENNGEPVNGEYIAVIDLEDGTNPQRFKGPDKGAVADKLLEAQAHASRTINEQKRTISTLRKPDAAAATAPLAKPRALTADESWQLAQDITDPTKAPAAIAKVFEATTGIAPAKLAERLNKEAIDDDAESAANEARIFRDSTPEYYNSDANNRKILKLLERENLPITRNNLAYAFEQLTADGLLAARPAPTTTQPEGTGDPGVRVRERGETRSTGIREGDSSAVPGTRSSRPKYTAAQIEAMSTADYNSKLAHEPGFRELVDSM